MDDVDNDDGNDDVAAASVVVVCSRVLTSYHSNGKPAILLNRLLKIQVSFGLSSIMTFRVQCGPMLYSPPALTNLRSTNL